MANEALTGIQLAAALAEEIYRRNSKDIPITLAELGAQARDVGQVMGLTALPVTQQAKDGYYYYSNRGFVGQVVEKGGIFYVVFRGTDSSEGFVAGAASPSPRPSRGEGRGEGRPHHAETRIRRQHGRRYHQSSASGLATSAREPCSNEQQPLRVK